MLEKQPSQLARNKTKMIQIMILTISLTSNKPETIIQVIKSLAASLKAAFQVVVKIISMIESKIITMLMIKHKMMNLEIAK